ncbi:helix-turn-helix domain-containing protein [Providencia sp. Me31A]|uniref:helix-turn-helix domain-containing protein n=1 Tax=Providencia sp. Me31A TaxID=3392637 RepID=UPI003D2B53C3
MKARLKNALALLECYDVETLAVQFLTCSFSRSAFSGLIISLVNKTENKLESWNIDHSLQVQCHFLDTDINDADHPLIQLVLKGAPTFWKNLQQGSYINNAPLRNFISQLPVNTGLFSLPLHDLNHKSCGAIILLGQAKELENFEQGIFPIYCELFHQQLKRILELANTQQKISHLQYINQLHREKEVNLNEALNTLTASIMNMEPARRNIKNINDLEAEIERYEKEILLDKQQELKGDIDAMAKHLNISKRALIYKLKKYGV